MFWRWWTSKLPKFQFKLSCCFQTGSKGLFVQMKQGGEKLINTFPGTIKYMHVIFGFYEINYILLNYLFYMEIVLSIY